MPDLGFARGLITILTLAVFLGICWWAYRPGNRTRFEEDGWLAFDEDEIPEVVRAERVSVEEDRR